METRTTEELLQRAIDQITRSAQEALDEECEIARRVAAKIESQGLDYTVRWIENDLHTSHFAHLWHTVEMRARTLGGGYVEALEFVVEQTKQELLANRIIERSSSALSNAVTYCKAQAAAKFVENGVGWLEVVREYEDRIA